MLSPASPPDPVWLLERPMASTCGVSFLPPPPLDLILESSRAHRFSGAQVQGHRERDGGEPDSEGHSGLYAKTPRGGHCSPGKSYALEMSTRRRAVWNHGNR